MPDPVPTRAPVDRAAGADHAWTLAGRWLLLAYGALVLLTWRDYGVTQDEFNHARYGDEILRWFTSGFTDTAALTHRRYLYLGGLFDVLAALLSRVLPFDLYQVRHLLGAGLAVLGAFYTRRLGTLLAGPPAGTLAALCLILTPAYYGHGFNNPKDIPLAALSIASLYYLAVAVRRMPRIPWPLAAKLGLAIGLTLAVRVLGLSLLVYFGLAFLLWLLVDRLRLREPGESPHAMLAALAGFAPRFALTAAIAYPVMLVCWPAAQAAPVRHVLTALKVLQDYDWNLPVLFEGQLIRATELPRHYVAKWLLISLPEFYFIGVLLAVAAALAALVAWSRRRVRPDADWVVYGILLTAIGLPLLVQAARRAVVYDAWRHFLFLAPMLSVLVGVAFARTLERSRGPRRRWGLLPLALAALSAGATAVEMVVLHPYQTIYFNRMIAGGLPNAAGSYETDYWGNSYKAGVEWVQEHFREGEPDRRIRVSSCRHPFSTSHFLTDPRFEYVPDDSISQRPPDLFLATTRWNCHLQVPGRVIHVVEREGVPILYVKQVPP